MIDRTLVTLKLENTQADLEMLATLSAAKAGGGMARVSALAAERLLERVIGRMIDLNYHLISSLGGKPPSGYHGSFTSLVSSGVLPPDFDRMILPAARLRNRIVHEYDGMKQDEVFSVLDNATENVPTYLHAIREFLEKNA